MIDCAMFENREIVAWENCDKKSYKKACKYFEKLVSNEETYAHLVGSTAINRSDERDSGKITGIL